MSFVNLIKKSAIMKKPMKKIVEIKKKSSHRCDKRRRPRWGAPAADQ
jgi:hypothetical protein